VDSIYVCVCVCVKCVRVNVHMHRMYRQYVCMFHHRIMELSTYGTTGAWYGRVVSVTTNSYVIPALSTIQHINHVCMVEYVTCTEQTTHTTKMIKN
jgi:hypothetical protein